MANEVLPQVEERAKGARTVIRTARGLTLQQERAALVLAQGESTDTAAAVAGAKKHNVLDWQRSIPAFRKRVADLFDILQQAELDAVVAKISAS